MADATVTRTDGGARLSVVEKVGYGLGDTAANFIFQTMVMFQLAFYTDTFGITAAAAGTLLVVVRVWDAIFDPMMGVVADRTNTRWGKFRPWVLWTAVPFGLMGFLAFVTPDFGPGGKLAYAYVTYIALMMVYSANNLPYSALSGVMTGDLGERTSLSSYRFVCAMIAQLVIQGLALPMVHHFGQGNNAKGYQFTIGIFSALAVVLFLITFATTKERIQPAPDQKASVGQHFADLVKNGPWLVMFILTLVLFITLSMRGSVVPYYFNYYADKASLARLLGGFGVNVSDEAAVVSFAFSAFNVLGTLATIVAIFFSKALATTVRQAEHLHRRPRRHDPLHRDLRAAAGNGGDGDVRDRDPPAVRLRLHDSAALGDDGRRRRLLGVEDRASRDGHRVCGHRVRAEGGPGLRRRDHRLRAVALRLRAQRGAVGVGTRRYPADDGRLPGNHLRDLCGLPVLLHHRQGDRDPDDERTGGEAAEGTAPDPPPPRLRWASARLEGPLHGRSG